MSQIADRFRKILHQISSLAEELACSEPILDAYLYLARVRCGKESCRCMTSDTRHESWCISYTEDGKSRTRTVPLESLAIVRRMTDRYRRLRSARSELTKQARAILRLVDASADREVTEGKKVFQQVLDRKNTLRKRS